MYLHVFATLSSEWSSPAPPPPTKLMYLHTNMCTPNCNSIVIENWKKQKQLGVLTTFREVV